jgi:hypothetical protein
VPQYGSEPPSKGTRRKKNYGSDSSGINWLTPWSRVLLDKLTVAQNTSTSPRKEAAIRKTVGTG